MRWLLVLLLASTASAGTFRWSQGKLECGWSLEQRSNGNQCRDHGSLVVAYPNRVIRYVGDNVKSGEKWSVDTKLASPIVSFSGSLVVLAQLDGGAVTVQTLDGATGAVKASAKVGSDLTAIQIKGLTIYARKKDGSGQILELDAALKPTTQDVPANAIRAAQVPSATPADGAATDKAASIAWENEALVLHVGKQTAKLVEEDRFRMQLVTMHVTGDKVLVTLHHSAASGTVAFAFDLKTGARLWAIDVTGIGPVVHSAYYNKVSAKLDGDFLVVQGVEAGGAYVCTIGTDGVERACVDGITGTAVFDPPAPKVVMKAVPHKIGPTTKSMKCKKTASPKSALAVKVRAKSIVGTITSPSSTCKPKLFGGIAGDRIELQVFETGGTSSCECTFAFEQETNKDSKTVTATHAGNELGHAALP